MAAELTDAQIDPVAEQFFSTLNGLTPLQWRGFARAILACIALLLIGIGFALGYWARGK